MHNVLIPFRKYSDFSGRASPREFWWFFALSAAVLIITVFLTGVSAETAAKSTPTWALAYVFWWAVTAVPWFALQVRRFHDQGRSGWLVSINIAGYAALFIQPLAGMALLAISLGLMALRGERVRNRYGEAPEVANAAFDPVGASTEHYIQTASQQPIRDQHGVLRLPDGTFECAGLAFPSYKEAYQFGLTEGRRSTRRPSEADSGARRNATIEGVLDSGSKEQRSENRASSMSVGADKYEVKPTSDGRFMSGGYTFTTRAQAESYAQRRRGTAAPSSFGGASAGFPDNTAKPATYSGPKESWAEIEPGIKLGRDGQFYVRGYAHPRLDDARRAAAGYGHRPVSTAQPQSVSAPRREPSQHFIAKLAKPFAPAPAAHWIAEPTTVEVAGIEFQGELLYYGKGDRRSNHRALVDPTLSVASDADSLGTSLGYWPNYSELTPSARRAYLEWLASGRCAPNAPIGYVFVYFYGLERRLIAEKSEQDAAAILAEARRLLDLYGDNHSFRNYCGALIEAGELIFEIAPPHNAISLDMRRGWEIPISIRVRLGRKVREGIAIDSDDALCWALTHPQLYPRTAVSRCFDQFCALWRYRFAERFPDGIKVRGGKTRLQFNYRAASGEFNAHAELEDLPDIGAIAGPVTKLEALLTACTEELDPLSRFLGRNPEERATLLAAALCPAEALDDRAQTLLSAARTLLFDGSSKDGFAQNPVGKVLEVLAENPGELAADRRAFLSKRLPEILDAMQIGFEPDKRYGPAPTLSDDTMLCLFEMDKSIKAHQDRDEYRSARTMIEIAVLAAKADDQVVEAEMSVILDDVAQIVGLDSNDHQRLRAHAQALALNPSKMRAATNRLLALPEAEKDRVMTTAVRAILADQRVLPSEVRFLEGLYKSLGKSQDEVYARLHSGEGSPRSQRTGKNQPVHAVDGERLERLRRETAAVSTMLSGIFREEVPASAETAAQPQPDERSLPGLDAAHSHVLLKLSEQPVEIETFDTLCREQRLLPDGAIETINDWAFDALDDIAIECEDIVSIQPHLIDKIRSMAAA